MSKLRDYRPGHLVALCDICIIFECIYICSYRTTIMKTVTMSTFALIALLLLTATVDGGLLGFVASLFRGKHVEY